MGLAAGALAAAALACNAPIAAEPTVEPTATISPIPTSTLAPAETPIPTATEAPPTGKIAFTCQIYGEVGRNQICSMNPDGSDFQRLTTRDNDDHFYPSIGPEGISVLFSSNMHGDYEIYEMPLDGEPIQLTAVGDAYAPAVSPDGTLIAFTRNDGVNASIWVMNRDGSNAHQVEAQAWDPAWSPDGTQLLHASDRWGEIQLHVVNVNGSGNRPVLQIEGLRGRNDWSLTGELLATYAGESWNREIVIFNLAGDRQVQLTNGGNNLAPSFSPDGRWIAFTSYMDRYRDDHGCEIYIMRVDGSEVRRLTDNEYCDWQPRWGP